MNVSFLAVTVLAAAAPGLSWGKGSLNCTSCCCRPECLQLLQNKKCFKRCSSLSCLFPRLSSSFPSPSHPLPPHLPPLSLSLSLCAQSLSGVRLSVTPWTVARQPPLSMGFPRQEYWSELPFPTPGTLPNPGIKPTSLMSPALASGFFATWKALSLLRMI